jgi:hypothetical protein
MKGSFRQSFSFFLGAMLILPRVGNPVDLLIPEADAAPPTAAAPSNEVPVMRPGLQVAPSRGIADHNVCPLRG